MGSAQGLRVREQVAHARDSHDAVIRIVIDGKMFALSQAAPGNRDTEYGSASLGRNFRLQWGLVARRRTLKRNELSLRQRGGILLVHRMHCLPRRKLAHFAHPAADVFEPGEVCADQVQLRHDGGAEIVGEGELIATQKALVSKPVPIEQLQGLFSALPPPTDGALIDLLGLAPMVRVKLW